MKKLQYFPEASKILYKTGSYNFKPPKNVRLHSLLATSDPLLYFNSLVYLCCSSIYTHTHWNLHFFRIQLNVCFHRFILTYSSICCESFNISYYYICNTSWTLGDIPYAGNIFIFLYFFEFFNMGNSSYIWLLDRANLYSKVLCSIWDEAVESEYLQLMRTMKQNIYISK